MLAKFSYQRAVSIKDAAEATGRPDPLVLDDQALIVSVAGNQLIKNWHESVVRRND